MQTLTFPCKSATTFAPHVGHRLGSDELTPKLHDRLKSVVWTQLTRLRSPPRGLFNGFVTPPPILRFPDIVALAFIRMQSGS